MPKQSKRNHYSPRIERFLAIMARLAARQRTKAAARS